MWIDTHCHLDDTQFDADRDAVVARARAASVEMVVIPSADVEGFAKSREIAERYGYSYALGIHPLWIAAAQEDAIEQLRDALKAARDDPGLVAVGEIGIDLLVAGLDLARQEWFFSEQLKVARDAGLPVIVHVRRSADLLLKHLRRIEVVGGIAHAYNGSRQQADQFVARGFCLGFGGALTYSGSQRIRRLAAELPPSAYVLETDAPFIPPEWLRNGAQVGRNEPSEIARIATQMAALRGHSEQELASQSRRNALAALPRLSALLSERFARANLSHAFGCFVYSTLSQPHRSRLMPAAALAAFVVGVWLLQMCTNLPSSLIIKALALVAGAGLIGAVWLQSRASSIASMRIAVVVIASLSALALGFAHAGWAARSRMADQLAFADEGRDVRVTGVIASLPSRVERGLRFEFDVEHVEPPEVHVPAHIAVGWYSQDLDVRPGERWAFSLRLKRPQGLMNPGGFDFEAWMLAQNLRASGYVRDGPRDLAPARLDAKLSGPRYAVERMRDDLRRRLLDRISGQRYGGVLLALILGDQRAISEADWTLFNRTGISHLVSISGLHITMLAGLGAWLVATLWRRSARLLRWAPTQTAAALAAMLTALAYSLLAGWGVPAQRTFFMLAVVAVAWIARGRSAPMSTLALAAALVALLDPWAVLAPGFWLSFGAVAAIFWAMSERAIHVQAESRKTKILGAIRTALRVQLAVTLALLPLTALIFHQLSLVSPLANAVAIPLVSWLVAPLALLAAVAVFLPAPLDSAASGLLWLANRLFELLAQLLHALSDLPWAGVPIPAPHPIVFVFAAIGAFWLMAPRGWPLRALGALWFVPLFAWPSEHPRAGELWVTALDVGQGSAILIEAQAQAWLFDTGPRYSRESDAGERVIVPYLRARGIGHLDGMVVSHLDSDHSGGAAAILRSIKVARLLSSIDSASPSIAGPVSAERCIAGQAWSSGALQFRMLHPTANDYERPGRSTNSMSCVLEVSLGPTRLLLTGDVPAAEEAAILKRGEFRPVRWLSAPHHGSRSSSSEAFVAAANAEWAMAQMGYRNRFGHPHPLVVQRYQSHGSELVRSDTAGASQWRFAADGSWQMELWRRQHASYWTNQSQPSIEATSATDEDNDAARPLTDAIAPL